MIKYKIRNIVGKENIKYEFLDYNNTSNIGIPGIGYSLEGGGYIILIREGDIISRIIIENLRLAPNKDPYKKKGISRKILSKLLYTFT